MFITAEEWNCVVRGVDDGKIWLWASQEVRRVEEGGGGVEFFVGEAEAELGEQAAGAFVFGMVAGEERGSVEIGESEGDYGARCFFGESATPEFGTDVDAGSRTSSRTAGDAA